MSLSRRRLLSRAMWVAAVATLGCRPRSPQLTSAPEPIVALDALQVGRPVPFTVAGLPALLIKLGTPVQGGVGPDRDIVAYGRACTHQGCPVQPAQEGRALYCPCHHSVFDPAEGGRCIQGPALAPLPRVELVLIDAEEQHALTDARWSGRPWGRLSVPQGGLGGEGRGPGPAAGEPT